MAKGKPKGGCQFVAIVARVEMRVCALTGRVPASVANAWKVNKEVGRPEARWRGDGRQKMG